MDRKALRHLSLADLAPFVGASLLPFLVVLVGEPPVADTQFALALALVTCAFGLGAVAIRADWPRVLTVAPFVFLLGSAFLRDAGGGAQSGVGPMALLPAAWLALHGTQRQFLLAIAALALTYILPTFLLSETAYPSASGWRTALVLGTVAALIGLTVQRLVGKVRSQAEASLRREDDLEHVAEVAREMVGEGARQRVCEAACEVSDASFALLFEPAGEDELVTTAMYGIDEEPWSIRPGQEPSATYLTLTSRRPLFAIDAGSHPAMNPRSWERVGRPASMLFEPIITGDRAVGVLVVGWHTRLQEQADRAAAIVRLLAAEAGVAIDRADLLARLRELAETDALTGLANRRVWETTVRARIGDARRTGEPFCVALVDIDHFKAVNDSWGHDEGDRRLKGAAAAWLATVRERDTLARVGGDEFAAALPGCSLETARLLLDRLRAATPGSQTVSIGATVWDGLEHSDQLMRRADDALFEAKAAGRDRVVLRPPAVQSER